MKWVLGSISPVELVVARLALKHLITVMLNALLAWIEAALNCVVKPRSTGRTLHPV